MGTIASQSRFEIRKNALATGCFRRQSTWQKASPHDRKGIEAVNHAMLSRKSEATPVVQAKASSNNASKGLCIGEPDDAFEQEANRVADEVISGNRLKLGWSLSNMSVGAPLRRKCSCGGSSSSEVECDCKKKKLILQRKPSCPAVGIAPPIVHEVLRTPGQPLDAQARSFFEPRFGLDLSEVRVHTDQRAAQSARAVDALAYTVGNNL